VLHDRDLCLAPIRTSIPCGQILLMNFTERIYYCKHAHSYSTATEHAHICAAGQGRFHAHPIHTPQCSRACSAIIPPWSGGSKHLTPEQQRRRPTPGASGRHDRLETSRLRCAATVPTVGLTPASRTGRRQRAHGKTSAPSVGSARGSALPVRSRVAALHSGARLLCTQQTAKKRFFQAETCAVLQFSSRNLHLRLSSRSFGSASGNRRSHASRG
jgi:hypothetical protein